MQIRGFDLPRKRGKNFKGKLRRQKKGVNKIIYGKHQPANYSDESISDEDIFLRNSQNLREAEANDNLVSSLGFRFPLAQAQMVEIYEEVGKEMGEAVKYLPTCFSGFPPSLHADRHLEYKGFG